MIELTSTFAVTRVQAFSPKVNSVFGNIKLACALSTADFCSAEIAVVSKPTILCAGKLTLICTSVPSADKNNSAAPCSCAPPAAHTVAHPMADAPINSRRLCDEHFRLATMMPLATMGRSAEFKVQYVTARDQTRPQKRAGDFERLTT